MPNVACPASRLEQACDDCRYPSAEPAANCSFAVKPMLSCVFHTALKNRTFAVVATAVEPSPHAAANSTVARTGTIEACFTLSSPGRLIVAVRPECAHASLIVRPSRDDE